MPPSCTSLRELLDEIERSDTLIRIDREVDPEYEVGALCRVASDSGNPALLLEHIRGSTIPIAANLYGTRRRIALALGSDERSLIADNQAKLSQPVLPVDPEPSRGPLEDRVILDGDDVDLRRLPIPLWNTGDGGPFITAGVVLAESTSDGPNAGVYRMQFHDQKTLGMYMAPDHHLRRMLEDPNRSGRVDVTVALGAPPALYIAASSDFGIKQSEAAIATSLQGTPMRWAEGHTNSLPWPVESEIVIEGFLDGSTREEGPFLEFTGCRTGSAVSPVFHVTALHHRRDPIFHAAFVGRPPNETATVWRELEEAEALRLLQERFAIVKGLHRPPDIGRDFWCVIQVDTRSAKPGMVKNLLLAAAYCVPRPKYVIVVDTDVDIYRLDHVLWALCMRVHPARDVTIVDGTMTSGLDPRGPTPPLTSKMLIDATAKPDAPGVVGGPPEEIVTWAKGVLADYSSTR
jgi:2,5-furandicarboxylate decarboxylase 1